MKNVTAFLPVLAAGLLLTSCSKEVSEMNEEPGVQIQMNNTEKGGSFFEVRNTGGDRPASGIVSYTGGYINATNLTITAENGKVNYATKVEAIENAFQPKNLGSIALKTKELNNARFALHVEPSNGRAAIHLNGTYTDNNAIMYPIQIVVNEPMDIQTAEEKTLNISHQSKLATMIQFGSMLETIPESFMTQAVANSGGNTVIISASTTPGLYAYIKSILPNMLKVDAQMQ